MFGVFRDLSGAARVRERPVLLEHRLHLRDDGGLGDEHTDFPPGIELEPTQALTTEERSPPVPDDRPDVKTPAGVAFRGQFGLLATQLPDDPYVNPRLGALCQESKHLRIARLRVVDQQLLARPADE